MIDILNFTACMLTIGFGMFGFVAPRFTADALDLVPSRSSMGLSEMRASVGGAFVNAGIAAIWINMPLAYAMIGFTFLGAVIGRVISCIFDNPPFRKLLIFSGIEAALAAWFLFANL